MSNMAKNRKLSRSTLPCDPVCWFGMKIAIDKIRGKQLWRIWQGAEAQQVCSPQPSQGDCCCCWEAHAPTPLCSWFFLFYFYLEHMFYLTEITVSVYVCTVHLELILKYLFCGVNMCTYILLPIFNSMTVKKWDKN